MFFKTATVFGLFLALAGCSTIATTPRPDSYHAPSPQSDDPPLFSTKGTMLEDRDIERILNYRISLPSQVRIAIMKLSGGDYWDYYSDELTQANESMMGEFVARLRSSPRVYDASLLPAMLVPERRTIPYLREAAARYQADLLLLYRSRCRSFEKYRLLGTDETRAYCSLEAVVLDIRSGIVPFTAASSNVVTAAKTAQDMSFEETMKKAEMQATARSLQEISARLSAFLAGVGGVP